MNKRLPSGGSTSDQDKVKKDYREGLGLWLAARSDRNDYLMPVNCSEPRLARIDNFTFQLFDMLPDRADVADLGFGPEGRDLADLLRLSQEYGKQLSLHGIELVPENVASALRNPSFVKDGVNVMEGRLVEGDITVGITLPDSSANAVILSSVIQHFPSGAFYEGVMPEIARVMVPGGVLQLIFKATTGESQLISLADPTLGGRDREFHVYNVGEVLGALKEKGFELYMGDGEHFGGVITWVDQRKPVDYAGMYMINEGTR